MSAKVEGSSKSAADVWHSPEVRAAVASLPRLISVWPSELGEDDLAGAKYVRLVAKLRRALRAERQRGIAGHWTYDLARHAELISVYRVLVSAHCQGNSLDPSLGCSKPPRSTRSRSGQNQQQNGPAP